MTETSTECPIQVVLGGAPEDCTFQRGHKGQHSWALPTSNLVTATQTAPHHCEFPVLTPWSMANPGPCDCGKTYLARIAEQRAAEAGLVVMDPEDLRAALTAKGPLPDALYDRLAAAAGVTR